MLDDPQAVKEQIRAAANRAISHGYLCLGFLKDHGSRSANAIEVSPASHKRGAVFLAADESVEATLMLIAALAAPLLSVTEAGT